LNRSTRTRSAYARSPPPILAPAGSLWAYITPGSAPGRSSGHDPPEYVRSMVRRRLRLSGAMMATGNRRAYYVTQGESQTSGSWLCEKVGWFIELLIFPPKKVSQYGHTAEDSSSWSTSG